MTLGNTVGTGFVPIKPDTKGFGAELEDGITKEGTTAAERSGKKVGASFQRAMAGVFTAGVALLGKSVFDFSGFERGMNEVFTLLPGISGNAMDTMTDQVKDFAVDFRVLPSEVVPALYQALSAGVPTDNVFSFLETATKLSKGGVTDLTTAVDGLSSVVNAYGPGVLSSQEASDLLFTTVKLGKTTIEELSSSIFQVTPTAASLGVAFSDVTAALSAMTLQGVPTSVATTQLRQLFVELSKDGSKAADTFQGLSGKTFRDFVASGGDVQGALQLMEQGATDSGLAISDMFGSVEAGNAALALTGGGTDAFTKALAGMEDSAGATDAAFDRMNTGFGATMDKFKAQFAVVLLNIGGAIAPTLGVVFSALTGVFDIFSKLPGPMQAVAVLVGTLSAGLFAFAGPILKGIQLFKQLGGAMSALAANPWMLALVALVTITILIIRNWDDVKRALSATWDWMKDAARATADFFVRLWHSLAGTTTEIWNTITGAITGAWDAVVGATVGAWDAVFSVVSTVGGDIVSFITGIPGAIGSAFSTLADVISAPFRAAFNTIKTVWNATAGGFGFSIPSWIPGLGGKDFRIPSMAQGGVVSSPTLALVGDAGAGNPEIVAPQSIIRETVMQALAQSGNSTSAAPIELHLTMQVSSEVRDPGFFETQARAMTEVFVRELERAGLGRGQLVGSTVIR